MTAVYNLKPLSMGQIFDRAIRLYRQHFLLFIGIIALSQIPATAFVILISLVAVGGSSLGSGVMAAASIGAFATAIVSIIMSQIGTAALTRAVANNYLGEKIGVLEAYRKIGRAWLSLLGALFLSLLLIIVLIIIFIIPCVGWAAAIPGIGGLVFLSTVVIPLIAPIIVLEGKGASQAIRRAWDLGRRRFWWVFGFVLLLNLFAQLVVTGPTALFQIFLLSVAGSMDPLLATVLQQLLTFLLNVVFLPIQLTCVTLLYFDLRVRTEGFDLALLTAQVEDVDVDVDKLTSETSTPTAQWSPSGTELGYFSMITIGVFVIGAGLVGILSLLGLAVGSAFGGL
ncbi:MAG: hypothetical protein H6658_03640 [Ardenticatenaceae bacterium]|nr:hypothetical protein [Ardenticatenaceae bacterium]